MGKGAAREKERIPGRSIFLVLRHRQESSGAEASVAADMTGSALKLVGVNGFRFQPFGVQGSAAAPLRRVPSVKVTSPCPKRRPIGHLARK